MVYRWRKQRARFINGTPLRFQLKLGFFSLRNSCNFGELLHFFDLRYAYGEVFGGGMCVT